MGRWLGVFRRVVVIRMKWSSSDGASDLQNEVSWIGHRNSCRHHDDHDLHSNLLVPTFHHAAVGKHTGSREHVSQYGGHHCRPDVDE
jgi:hypothetical protein